MAEQVRSRLEGDDYQHLISWWYSLQLLMPSKMVARIVIEDNEAGSVDDVTVEYAAMLGADFHQIKYHVNQSGEYSTDSILKQATPASRSLLKKFFDTWTVLTSTHGDKVQLHLVSNWVWDSRDPAKDCISGKDCSITDKFFEEGPNSLIGKQREKWRAHLNCTDEEFAGFIRTLRFRLGFSGTEQLEQSVAERMMHLGLRDDKSALILAAGIIRSMIKNSKHVLTVEELEKVLQQHPVLRQSKPERTAVLYLSTIKGPEQYDLQPDYHLDWRRHFQGSPDLKTHQVLDASSWNNTMLPELQAMEPTIKRETRARLLKVRGFARLSPWFAVGHTFPEVGGYTIEAEQRGDLWRSDVPPSPEFKLSPTGGEGGEQISGKGDTVAVGISITGGLEEDVRKYLRETLPGTGAVLFLRPSNGTGPTTLQGAADAVALAMQAKDKMRNFAKLHGAKTLLLFYLGPAAGACFIGHYLNAVCPEIQIMEHQNPGYAPAFLLK